MFRSAPAQEPVPEAAPDPAPAPGQPAHVLPRPGDQCDACPAKVQVVIATSAGPFGFCAHHGRVLFDPLVLAGLVPSRPQHIGDIKPWH